MDQSGIRHRVVYWRVRRGMTQEALADALGKSLSWMKKFEQGDRQVDPRLSVLEQIAEVLQIPLDALLSDETNRRVAQCVDPAEIAAIRDALYRSDVLTGAFANRQAEPAPDLAILRRQVEYGWSAFQAARYSVLGRTLPRLIVEAQWAAADTQASTRQEALTVLSMTYRLVASTLLKFADGTLAWHAADRAITVAEQTGDPVTIGSAVPRAMHALFVLGDGPAAVALGAATAERLQPSLAVDAARELSVYGMLFLKAAAAAAESADAGTSQAMLAEAAEVARRLGADRNEEWTAFGPTNVALHEVSTLVQLGEGARAAAAAARVTREHLAALPRERRAAHFVHLAIAHHLAGRPIEAVAALLEAERWAPEEARCRPEAHQLMTQLARFNLARSSRDLLDLAQRAGVHL